MNIADPTRSSVAPGGTGPLPPAITPLVVITGVLNIIVPLIFALFAWEHAKAFVETLRISNLLILAKTMLDMYFYVRKSAARFVSTSAYAWLIALGGSVAPLMFRPSHDPSDFWIATVIQMIGGVMQICAIVSLNRSFGLVAANRGIRRDGMYRLVRHPLYLTYAISQFGYVLNHMTSYNLGILTVAACFQLLRVFEEERLLLKDEEYRDYARQTPWRLLPYVF